MTARTLRLDPIEQKATKVAKNREEHKGFVLFVTFCCWMGLFGRGRPPAQFSHAILRVRPHERTVRLTVRGLVDARSPRIAGGGRASAIMLRNAHHIESFELRATDGAIGHVTDFFFDDRRWMVRYFVVETGTWLDHREVLIAPASVHVAHWDRRTLAVELTRDQVRHSPTIDTEEPVSREQEVALTQYYSWPMYWGAAGFADPMMLAAPPFLPVSPLRERHNRAASTLDEQHHVRSVADVRGYRIEATDGEIGHVDDFLIDDTDWRIGFLVVDTRNWWPGKRVLVAPEWIYEVGWDEAKVYVDLTRNAVKASPAFDPNAPLPPDYTDQLHAHYGYPRRSAEP